jgi:hypothetical protein
MIRAAERDADASLQVLDRLLARSKIRLRGIDDPLGVDFGAHRWLTEAREEAWSDWLAWILEQNGDTRQILKLFELDPTGEAGNIHDLRREHSTQNGRLDLVIEYGNETLVVEVKTKSAMDEDQLSKYDDWVKRARASRGSILLAIDDPGPLIEGWQFRSWETVSMGLRTWACGWLEKRRIEATLTLAFCGAIEKNLLGFGEKLNARKMVEYLETWLGRKQK